MDKSQSAAEANAAESTAWNTGKRKRLSVILAVSAIVLAIGIAAAVIIPRFFHQPGRNEVEAGFSTVLLPVPEDGSTPADHTAIENVGYMNSVFKAQKTWYSEMHGETDAAVMTQKVSTYKQYANDVLIVADVTKSSLVKSARQFCYVGDEVLWRLGSSYDAETFDEMLSLQWESGDPCARMSKEEFMAQNGLPASEFCVYVINEETLLSADRVVKNGDGTYSQTYRLDPAKDKAPAYYANQMVFSGGLTALPEFSAIEVTFTFDEDWRILKSVVDESYRAALGLSVNCSSRFTTDFEYDTPRAESTAYEEYFVRYAGKGEAEEPEKPLPTLAGCLADCFERLAEGAVSFDAELTAEQARLSGALWLDIGDMTLNDIDLRADFGALRVWLEEGTAYLSCGSLNGKAAAEEFLALPGASEGGQAFAVELLEQLGKGDFRYDDAGAELNAELSLGDGGVMPLKIAFLFDEEGGASLGEISLSFEAGGMPVGLKLVPGEREPAPLTAAEKAAFADLSPVLERALPLIGGRALSFGGSVSIDLGDTALSADILRGTLEWGNGFALTLECGVRLGGAEQRLYLTADDEELRIVCGKFGLCVALGDQHTAEELSSLFARVQGLAERLGIQLQLPDLSSLLSFDPSDLAAFLNGMRLTEVPDALLGAEGNGFTLRIAEHPESVFLVDGEYAGEGVTVQTQLSVDVLEEALQLPSADYFTLDDLNELLGYIEAVFNTLSAPNVSGELSFAAGDAALSGEYRKQGNDRYLLLSGTESAARPLFLQAWLQGGEQGAVYVSASNSAFDAEGALTLKLPLSELGCIFFAPSFGDILGSSGMIGSEGLGQLIGSVTVGDVLSLTLDGSAFGLQGDIEVQLEKKTENGAAVLGALCIAVGDAELRLNEIVCGGAVSLPEVPSAVQYDLTGLGSLAAEAIGALTDVGSGSLALKDGIFLNGTVTMAALGDPLVIAVSAAVYPQTEDGLVVNARLHYEKNALFNQGAATVDLTVKGGKIMMRRDIDEAPVQTTTEEFSADIKYYVSYLLNASKLVEMFFPEIEIALPEESADLGAKAAHFISAYSGSELTVNGGALLGSKFGDVGVSFGAAENGAMKIDFSTSVTIVLKSTVSGSMTLCGEDEMEYVPADLFEQLSDGAEEI